MTHSRLILVLLVGLLGSQSLPSAEAAWPWGRGYGNYTTQVHAANLPWHHGYAYQNYATPLAQVVPPTANMQMNYRWGVPSSRMTPIYHQFNRVYPGGITGHPSTLARTPYQPSDTNQFGVYYVRGPWEHQPQDLGYGWHLFRPDLGYGWHLGPRRTWVPRRAYADGGVVQGDVVYGHGEAAAATEEGYVPGTYRERPIGESPVLPAAPPEAPSQSVLNNET